MTGWDHAAFERELGEPPSGVDDDTQPAPATDIVLWNQFQLDREEHDLIEGGLIEDRGLHYIIGSPGAAKTFFALAAGAAIAGGTPFLGRKTTQAGVYYLAAERPDSVMLRSFALRGQVGADIPFAMIRSPVDLGNSAWLNNLAGDLLKHRAEVMSDMPPRVLMIDTLAAATPGLDENNGSQTSRVIANLVELGKALQCAVVVVHHMGKDTARGARGHSNQLGRADQETTLQRRTDKDGNKLNLYTVRLTKMRDGEDGMVITFRLVVEKVGETRSGKPIETCRIELVEEQLEDPPTRRKTKKLTKADQAFDELLNLLCDSTTRVAIPMSRDIPSGTAGVKVEVWKARLELTARIDKDAAGRQAWKRLKDDLMSQQKIRITGEYVWPVTL